MTGRIWFAIVTCLAIIVVTIKIVCGTDDYSANPTQPPETAASAKPPASGIDLAIYHGTDTRKGVSTGTDISVYTIGSSTRIHIQINCSAVNLGDMTFWILDTDGYHQYNIFTVTSYNTRTGFIKEYYKNEYFPRSYCVSDLPCLPCSPSPGDHWNYICPKGVDTYYAEYPADTTGDYVFRIVVNELERIPEIDKPEKNNEYIFGAHIVVDSATVGCSPNGVCYKGVRDDSWITQQMISRIRNAK